MDSQSSNCGGMNCSQLIRIPINDLEQKAPGKYDDEEKELRCKLAACYRLVDFYGWSLNVYNHISVRTRDDNFLINPFGLMFHEITASSLLKVNLKGEIIDPGSTPFTMLDRGYTLHSAIHGARHDIKCALHLHVPDVVAIASLKRPILPLHQEVTAIGKISYHQYNGILSDLVERTKIVESLGPENNVMVLKNHGFFTGGETIEAAFFRAYFFVLGVRAQVPLLAVPESLWNVTPEMNENAEKTYKHMGFGEDSGGIHWGFGEINWEAWMRMLDDMGLKTGYVRKLQFPK